MIKLAVALLILLRLVLFFICLMVCLPAIYAFPAYFGRGITNFLNKNTQDMLKFGLIGKEEAEKIDKENNDD